MDYVTTVKEHLTSRGVKYCVGAYVDIHGVPKGKFVPVTHFDEFAAALALAAGLEGIRDEYNLTVTPWEIERYARLY